MAIYILPIIIISGLLVENFKLGLNQKEYLVIISILVLLAQNLIKDQEASRKREIKLQGNYLKDRSFI